MRAMENMRDEALQKLKDMHQGEISTKNADLLKKDTRINQLQNQLELLEQKMFELKKSQKADSNLEDQFK